MGNGEVQYCHRAFILVKHTRSAVSCIRSRNVEACKSCSMLLLLCKSPSRRRVVSKCPSITSGSRGCVVQSTPFHVRRPHSDGTCSCKKHLRRYSPAAVSRPYAALFSTVLIATLTQVKAHLGKVVYKGDFLPLLRKYRQDQDTPRLTAGARRERCSA